LLIFIFGDEKMEFLRQTDVIQWRDGQYKTIKENSVDDEYTYLFIDYLPPRKFSTYPKDLEMIRTNAQK
jgi:FdhD protein/cysteine desulfurase